MPPTRPPSTDIITVDGLSLTTTIGPDVWGRLKPQPLLLTVHLHLHPVSLSLAATTDEIRLSVFYWELANDLYDLGDAAIGRGRDIDADQFLVPDEERKPKAGPSAAGDADVHMDDSPPTDPPTPTPTPKNPSPKPASTSPQPGPTPRAPARGRIFPSALALARHATRLAHAHAGEAAAEVRIELHAPKACLRATRGLVWDVLTTAPAAPPSLPVPPPWAFPPHSPAERARESVSVHACGIALGVVLGGNPEELGRKQRVDMDIWFVENMEVTVSQGEGEVDYAAIVDRVAEEMELSSFKTLEKFVHEACRVACVASYRVREVTVRAAKPSAVAMAEGFSLQLTRPRSAFICRHMRTNAS